MIIFRYLQKVLPFSIISQCYFFNTFFYDTFTKYKYEKVRKWTRNIDIFKKNYLFIPINDK